MTAQEIIDTIEKTYKSSDLIYEMMFAHFCNLSGFGFQTVTMKQGSCIIRARYSGKMDSFVDLPDVSYPQKCYVNNFSRLNRPGQNLFYASESELACLSEMLPFWFDEFKTGDLIKVTLGKWIARHDLKLLIIPDRNNSNQLNTATIKNLYPEEIVFWDYISSKYKASTKDDKNIYEFTSAFANALWLNAKQQDINVNGFIYSSVQLSKNVNIALSTDTIDTGFLIPSDFVEIPFQRNNANDSVLPKYLESGLRKMGIMNFDKSQIEWIE
jgi:hypothetical protein